MKKLLIAGALSLLATTAHAATGAFHFGSGSQFGWSSGIHDIGKTHLFFDTTSGLTLVAAGFDAAGKPTDLTAKNDSGDENGMGLANDSTKDGEIEYGKGFVQIDMTHLVNVTSLKFSMGSTTKSPKDEEWAVYGSNTSGSYSGAPLATGFTDVTDQTLTLGYKYYDFVEIGAGSSDNNVLLDSVKVTASAAPEPASWALMMAGVGAMGAALRVRRRRIVAA